MKWQSQLLSKMPWEEHGSQLWHGQLWVYTRILWSYPVKLQNTWSVLSFVDCLGKARLILESREWIISGNLSDTQFHTRGSKNLLYPRKPKPLCIFHSACFPWDPHPSLSLLVVSPAPSNWGGRFGIYYLPQRPAQEVRQIWGKGTQTSADSMSRPYPSNPCKEISLCTVPIPEIADAGCSLV